MSIGGAMPSVPGNGAAGSSRTGMIGLRTSRAKSTSPGTTGTLASPEEMTATTASARRIPCSTPRSMAASRRACPTCTTLNPAWVSWALIASAARLLPGLKLT